MNDILISVLTPTFNRASYLHRVWEGLRSQTVQQFEWIVADDGSTDDTGSVVRKLAEKSEFPVTLIQASTRVGKARIDNEAVARAQGEFILWCDSDDWLLPNAIERLLWAWHSIPESARDRYVGVTALCATEAGIIVNPFPNVEYLDTTWNDLAEVHRVTSDMLYFTRASDLKAHPFPEVDFVVPESVVWTAIGNKKTRFIPEVLKMVEYRVANAISFTGKMEYNRGRAHALATATRNLAAYRRSAKVRWWRLVTFIRYSVHGEISYRDQLHLWGNNSPTVVWAMMSPLAWLLALKDRLQGKVRRTHREFLAASQIATITCQRLQGVGSGATSDLANQITEFTVLESH